MNQAVNGILLSSFTYEELNKLIQNKKKMISLGSGFTQCPFLFEYVMKNVYT